MSFFAPVQLGVVGIAGMVLDWLNIAVVFAILYMLFQLVTNGTNLGGLFGGKDKVDAKKNKKTLKTGTENSTPPGVPKNVHHKWDEENGRYQIGWDHRPEEENVVEYQVQRRESPSLKKIFTKRFLTGNLFGGWQTIGRTTTNGFDDTGSSVRWKINPRNLTYPGNKTLRPDLAYEYRVRAINSNSQKGSWSQSSEIGERKQPTPVPQPEPQQLPKQPEQQKPSTKPNTITVTGTIGQDGKPSIQKP